MLRQDVVESLLRRYACRQALHFFTVPVNIDLTALETYHEVVGVPAALEAIEPFGAQDFGDLTMFEERVGPRVPLDFLLQPEEERREKVPADERRIVDDDRLPRDSAQLPEQLRPVVAVADEPEADKLNY